MARRVHQSSGIRVRRSVLRGERLIAEEEFREWLRNKLQHASYRELARRWSTDDLRIDVHWLYDVTNGRQQTVDIARVDQIITIEGSNFVEAGLAIDGVPREKLPPSRNGVTTRVEIYDREWGTVDLYVTTGEHEDGRLGEIFVKLGFKADTVQALVDCWATSFSFNLQHGVDFELLCRKFAGRQFAPKGPTDDERIPTCTSIVDYIVTWLATRYGSLGLISELQQLRDVLG